MIQPFKTIYSLKTVTGNKNNRSEEKSQDLSTNMLSPRFFVVHNSSGRR
jgi:hypothetical protein